MANLLALSPVLILLLGALGVVLFRVHPHIPPVIAPAAVFVSMMLIQANTRQPDLVPYLFPAAASAPDIDLAFSFATGGEFFATLALIAFLSLMILESSEKERQDDVSRLLTLSGVVVFFLAANWTTLAAGWLLADVGMLVWSLSGSIERHVGSAPWRALALSQFGVLLFLGAGVLVLNGGSSLRFESSALSGLPADLVFVSAWMRSGLYPFQTTRSFVSGDTRHGSLEQAALTFWLGTFLVMRSQMITVGGFAFPSALYSLALVGVGATTFMVLGATGSPGLMRWTTLALSSPILLTPFVASIPERPSIVFWLGVGLFNLAIIYLGLRTVHTNTRRRPLRRIGWGLAILVAAGLPISPAFLGRVGLYASAIRSGEGVFVAGLSAATTLAIVPLCRELFESRFEEGRNPNPLEYLGIAGLILPALAEGVFPLATVSFLGRGVLDASAFAFDSLYQAQNVMEPVLLLGALILPLPLALVIVRAGTSASGRRNFAPQWLLRVLDLSSVGRAMTQVLDFIGLTARQVSALVEQHSIGWILFAALWLAVWLLNGFGGR
jgi:hypothetical protein